MAGRLHDNRIFALPDLHDSSSSTSPVSTLSPLPKAPFNSKPNPSYQDNQFVLPAQAFVPIKDATTVQKEAKKRELESIFQQQMKLQDKVRDLELSNQHLMNEVNSLKKNNKEAPTTLDGQTEHALRNATDMTLYLTKKLQNMHEAITKLEVRVQEQEKNLQEEKGGLAALADKVVEIEGSALTPFEEQITKQGNELLMYRDSLQDLKKKLFDEQNERKHSEQKIFDVVKKLKDDNQHQIQQLQQQLQQQQPQQSQKHQQHPNTPPQFVITSKIEDQIADIAENVFKKHKNTLVAAQPPLAAASDKVKTPENDRSQRDELNRLSQLENELKRNENKRWSDFKKEHEQEMENIQQTFKMDRSKLNQEFKTIRESISLLADKQIDHHKSMQEKLQAEILTRQQFECDTLRQMTTLDEKLIKLGSNYPSVDNSKKPNAGKGLLMLREVDSLKKMIIDTERNLEQKIENSISKLKPGLAVGKVSKATPDVSSSSRSNENLEEALEKCKQAGVKNANDLKKMDTWKTTVNECLDDFKRDIEKLKAQTRKLMSNPSPSSPPIVPINSSNKDLDMLHDVNRRIRIMDESIDDYKIFKETTNDTLESLKRKMKLLNDSANKIPDNKSRSNDEYSASPRWREQIELNVEDIQKEIKHLKEKIAKNEQKMTNLRNDLEQETRQRTDDDEKLKEQIKGIKPTSTAPTPVDKPNSAKEGLKKMANALQGTKNVLAMKMQYEEKERKAADDFLQKQIDEINTLLDELDKNVHSNNNKNDPKSNENKDPDTVKKKPKPKKKDSNDTASK